MKIIKLTALAALMLAFVLLAACSDRSMERASGTYVGQYSKLVGEDIKDTEAFSLILASDGSGTHTHDGSEFSISWKLNGESFTMQESFLGVSIEYSGSLKDGVLDIFNGEPNKASTAEYVYKKK